MTVNFSSGTPAILYESGMTLAQVATALRCSMTTVLNKMDKVDADRRRTGPASGVQGADRMDKVISLRKSGATYRTIGSKFRITGERVRQLLKATSPELTGCLPRKMLTVECRVCGAPITGRANIIKNRRVCSMKCNGILKTRRALPAMIQRGQSIVRQRLNGEPWSDIAVSRGLVANDFARIFGWARTAIEHGNYTEAEKKTVFPGAGQHNRANNRSMLRHKGHFSPGLEKSLFGKVKQAALKAAE